MSTPLTIPSGWHVSWLGRDDGSWLCQIQRHDNDLDYISDITFVSRKGGTMVEAINESVSVILKEYAENDPQ